MESLYGQGHLSCGARMTPLITVSITEEFPDPSMSVTTIILCILLNIIPSFICTVVFCKHLFIVVAVMVFFPEKVPV